jgi:hypothetical protein
MRVDGVEMIQFQMFLQQAEPHNQIDSLLLPPLFFKAREPPEAVKAVIVNGAVAVCLRISLPKKYRLPYGQRASNGSLFSRNTSDDRGQETKQRALFAPTRSI